MGNKESVPVSRFNDRKSMPIISPCPLAPVVRLTHRIQGQPAVVLTRPCCSNEDWTDLGGVQAQGSDSSMSSQLGLPGILTDTGRCSSPCVARLEGPPISTSEFVVCACGCHLLSIQPVVSSVHCQAFVHQAVNTQDVKAKIIDSRATSAQTVHHKAISPQEFNPKTIDPQTINPQDFNPEPIDPQAVNLPDVYYQSINTQAVSIQAFTTHDVQSQLSLPQTSSCANPPPDTSTALTSLTSSNLPSESLSCCAVNKPCAKEMLEDEVCLVPTEFASQLSGEEVLEEMTEADQAARLEFNQDLVLRERGSSCPLKLEPVLFPAGLKSSAHVSVDPGDTVLDMDDIDVNRILLNTMSALSLRLDTEAIPNKEKENYGRDTLEECTSLREALKLDTAVTRQHSSGSLTSSTGLSPNDVEVCRCSLYKNQLTGEYYTVSVGSLDSNSVGSSPTINGPHIVHRVSSTPGDHSVDHVANLLVNLSMGSNTGGLEARLTAGCDSGNWTYSREENDVDPVEMGPNNMGATNCSGAVACGIPREKSCTLEKQGANEESSSVDSSSTLASTSSSSSSPWGHPDNENFSRNMRLFLTAGTGEVDNNNSHNSNSSKNNDSDNDREDENEAYSRLQVALYRSVRFYVAFLCCAEDNLMDFGLPFHRMLENWGLPICREMDLDAGVAKYEGMARCVEERCNGKIIVILSKTYADSDECLFLTYFAKTLDPASKNRNIIPVMIDKEVRIPNVIMGLSIIKYNYAVRCGWLKKKLVSALAA